VFDRDAVRIPIETCRHCGGDVKDYGGHRKYLNPKGLNLTDVWKTFPPYVTASTRSGPRMKLAPIILERVIRLTTGEGDLVCDPFAGGGVTAYVAERLNAAGSPGSQRLRGRQAALDGAEERYTPRVELNQEAAAASGNNADAPALWLF